MIRILDPDPNPDPLVRGMDPRIRIRIHPKMAWIRNTGSKYCRGSLFRYRYGNCCIYWCTHIFFKIQDSFNKSEGFSTVNINSHSKDTEKLPEPYSVWRIRGWLSAPQSYRSGKLFTGNGTALCNNTFAFQKIWRRESTCEIGGALSWDRGVVLQQLFGHDGGVVLQQLFGHGSPHPPHSKPG
jgi:hypothetical protein